MKKSNPNKLKIKHIQSYSKRYLPLPLLRAIGVRTITHARLANILATYSLVGFFCLLAFIFTFLLRTSGDRTPFFLIYTLICAITAWFGGIQAGIITTLVLSIESVYFFIPPPLTYDSIVSNSLFPELVFYFFVSSLVSFIVNIANNANEVSQFKKREKQYAQTFLELHDEYTKAKAEIKARDEFLTIASHELKTPLTTMLLKLHHMLHTIRSVSLANFSVPELMSTLENAQYQIKRLTALINDLLNVSLITTGRMDLSRERIDLVDLTSQVIGNFSEIIKGEGYIIEFENKGPVVGLWDRDRIEQALINLLSNAIKYGNHKPIHISVIRNGTKALFKINDHGVGIPKNKYTLLFGLFKRADTTTQKGLGVGLYITQQIVKAHKGNIKVTSFPKLGTTFTLELPLEDK